MSNYISVLICLFVFLVVSTLSTVSYLYEEEQALVRSIHEQLMREMASDGYLDQTIAHYYEQALQKEGFETTAGPFFLASHTNPNARATKAVFGLVYPAKNFVELETRVRPTFTTSLITWLQTGSGDIIFHNQRESQFIPNEP